MIYEVFTYYTVIFVGPASSDKVKDVNSLSSP